MNKLKNFKFCFSKILIIVLLSFPLNLFASYEPVDGRITYLVGGLINSNFQENVFNSNDSVSKLGRSQSFALLLQGLGDLNAKSSLMAEVTFGHHTFRKEKELFTEEFQLEAVTFDLGYRRRIVGNFWGSILLGSMYPWNIKQDVQGVDYENSDFDSTYSINLGLQYEGSFLNNPVSYDFRFKKYMNGQLDDQVALGFSVGWRFNVE